MNQRALVVALLVAIVTSPWFAMGSPSVTSPAGQQSGALATDWRLVATDHFDITFTSVAADNVESIGAVAERAYGQVSSQLMHELSLRPLLVLFSTRYDLERAIATRTVPGNREHVLWALDTPPAQVSGQLVHELTHVFAFDIVRARRDIPGWLHEGLAEFARGEWVDGDVGLVREMLRLNTLPMFRNLLGSPSADASRVHTVVGHLAFEFLVARTGEGSVRRVLLALRDGAANPMDTYLAATGLAADDFDREFSRYVRSRFGA